MFKKWNTGCDSDWNQGYSKCQLYRSDRNTAIFQGTLNSELPKVSWRMGRQGISLTYHFRTGRRRGRVGAP